MHKALILNTCRKL